MKKQKFFRASDRSAKLEKLRNESIMRGKFVGFTGLDKIYTMKVGYPLFIAGAPHAGKTEFALELLVSMSEMYEWQHFIYLGETGSVDEVIAELCHKYVQSPYRKFKNHKVPNEFTMTDDQAFKARMWVDEHFMILDLEDDASLVHDFKVEQFYKLVEEAEAESGMKFNTTLIDPWNDVEDESKEYGGEHKWLAHALRVARQSSKKNNRVDIIVNHIADIQPVFDKKSGKRYTPIALPTEWAGGRMWHRRAMTMLLVYRPPSFLLDEQGNECHEKNETIIFNQKAKPKGTGVVGHVSLFWDWKKSRFYEKTSDVGNRGIRYSSVPPFKTVKLNPDKDDNDPKS